MKLSATVQEASPMSTCSSLNRVFFTAGSFPGAPFSQASDEPKIAGQVR